MSTIHIDVERFTVQPPYKLPKNIYGVMRKISKALPFITSFFSLFYLNDVRGKVWELYQAAISDEKLGEEAFFDLMEIVFLNSLYSLSAYRKRNLLYRILIGKPNSKITEKALEWSAILISPKSFDKELREELKAVAKEAFHTFLAREKLSKNKNLKKEIVLRLKEIKQKNNAKA